MAQCQDLRVLSTAPTLPTSSSVVSLYANSTSGLVLQGIDGVPRWIGGVVSGTLPLTAVASGGISSLNTGVIFTSSTGTANQTGLAAPKGWLPFILSDGSTAAVPYYTIKQPGT